MSEWIRKDDVLKLIYDLSDMTTADVRENVKGEWIRCEDDEWIHYECSVCGEIIHHETLNFCPNCGAEMRGDKNV